LASAAMKKSYWQMHPFYTDAYSSEDTEWGNWMYRQGHKINYAQDSICVHSHNSPLNVQYRRKFVEGEADVFIFKKKPAFFEHMARWGLDVVRDVKYFLPRNEYMAIVKCPLQRFVYNYAYYRGMLIGYKRICATVGWKAHIELED
jgi:rhamnosyltransferase